MASAAPSTELGQGYGRQRERLRTYFDSTARRAWIDLTSDTSVSRIRQTVRAGRDAMRATLLSWLPQELDGRCLLDAGCGTGALSFDAAARGAHVTAIDVAGGLVDVARARGASEDARIDWRTGDMLDPALGDFDHVAAMDSLIHYSADDLVSALAALSARTRHSIVFTFAPYSPALAAMLMIGRLFPRANRSPAIVPVRESELRRRLAAIDGWTIGRSQRIASGFYKSHALELVRLA
ncbi:magnesium protoporphyrin IX methyltransferase [Sphingomonas rosea]|uniref:Magnesium protoporphyrin IX methyltransferase n=1 Tax=Sphingomonas rosea TaxID=335605 RepID=A0ABP7U594_9SPHN